MQQAPSRLKSIIRLLALLLITVTICSLIFFYIRGTNSNTNDAANQLDPAGTQTAQADLASTQTALSATKTVVTQLAPFDPYLLEYAYLPHLQDISAKNTPYIVGKVLPIETSNEPKVNQWLYYALPASLRAQSPAEVGTIILTSCSNVYIGIYRSVDIIGSPQPGGVAINTYMVICDLTIIDKAKAFILVKKTFKGPVPSSNEITSTTGVYGGPPIKDIRSYLNSIQ